MRFLHSRTCHGEGEPFSVGVDPRVHQCPKEIAPSRIYGGDGLNVELVAESRRLHPRYLTIYYLIQKLRVRHRFHSHRFRLSFSKKLERYRFRCRGSE
ncbi:hypothetical protein M413DRAFT_95917 [Hebeloma cylindrosporum]|uniref:Uncharacterized protein n=1 Tax=Hebeloma cylindrosporum TaxID=76867 RepID=A0A0C3CK59_HEBCY|nr:hypothetical protein M413DRAFT_95917 [Hebeloma cylindrosporum h7]